MNQPIDTSQNFVAIPPYTNGAESGALDAIKFYVVVSDERLNAAAAHTLSDGEIAGLVVGLVLAFLITLSVVAFLFVMSRKRKSERGDTSKLSPFSKRLHSSLLFSKYHP